MNGKAMTDAEMEELYKHLDYICTVMKTCIRPLYDAQNQEIVIGFILAPIEYFEGEMEVVESDAILEAEVQKPTDPKKLN